MLFLFIKMAGPGLAAFMLIFEYVAFERGVNMFHENLPTLYQMLESRPANGMYVQLMRPESR
ncbi:hypothetical protein GCM10010967_47890 [Dyadobacter beijingensis]|uniref:Uncharacterized protein n=1 Tax=Dyadobacter beijingensis TaxID=365489 RepID=A0ABQ2IER3_9BACT|nr:hypothetical protein GCM10010967_47890 [Dyadobacter beijingensis]